MIELISLDRRLVRKTAQVVAVIALLALAMGMSNISLAQTGTIDLTGTSSITITEGGASDFYTFDLHTDPIGARRRLISPEEVKAGGAATAVWLPAGELMLAPVAGTAEGTLVVDRVSYQGKDVQGLTLGFKAGRVASMSAKGGAFDAWKARYDAAGEGKDAFGMIDIGLNPALQVAPGSRLDTYVAAGGVVVSIGGNSFVGGTNESAYSWDFFLPGATVTVDGKPIVEKGVLKP